MADTADTVMFKLSLPRAGVYLLAALALVGCAAPPPSPPAAPRAEGAASAPINDPALLVRQFTEVVARMKPLAEAECRARAPQFRCSYQIVIDDRPGVPINAFHTIDPSGQPIIGFTLALIADARNADELAFVFGHEAAHHIAGHIPRSQQGAIAGAVLLGGLAALSGGGSSAVRSAQNLGAMVGARSYSKAFELEADSLGSVIAHNAGYDPLRGAGFFDRLPDPGNRFLGTHPPNAERREVVRRTVAALRAGQRL
jgi:predicted Zn-dependent protease